MRARALAWLHGMLQDPDGSPSSARVAGLLCAVTGCVVAVWGMAAGREQASTVVALLGGGAANLFARRKSEGTE